MFNMLQRGWNVYVYVYEYEYVYVYNQETTENDSRFKNKKW